jgi:prepilin-type N-terminal cleavage/methylation domain-containing protein
MIGIPNPPDGFFNVRTCANLSSRHRQAFSLIELLVVIAVISILASILLPGLSRAREYAYFTACKSNLRQIGIGVLLYAADNQGRMPEGYARCGSTHTDDSKFYKMRRIGASVRRTDGTGDWGPIRWGGKHGLVAQLYAHEPFAGGRADPMGEAGLPGKYLPIEILWCPMAGVKGWVGRSTEKERDSKTRCVGYFGYTLFLYSVGCIWDKPEHTFTTMPGGAVNPPGGMCLKVGQPWRPMTRSRQPHTSNPPSVWLAADLTPYDETNELPGHFGCRETWPDFRFNVAAIDGHVDDRIGTDNELNSGYFSSWTTSIYNEHGVYGWRHRNDDGWKFVTIMEGAVDKNKGQR